MGHHNALKSSTAQKAAHAIAPQKNTDFTPVIATTGADDGSGRKQITTNDILTLKLRFDKAEVPMDKRNTGTESGSCSTTVKE